MLIWTLRLCMISFKLIVAAAMSCVSLSAFSNELRSNFSFSLKTGNLQKNHVRKFNRYKNLEL